MYNLFRYKLISILSIFRKIKDFPEFADSSNEYFKVILKRLLSIIEWIVISLKKYKDYILTNDDSQDEKHTFKFNEIFLIIKVLIR